MVPDDSRIDDPLETELAIRNEYARHLEGATGYYRDFGATYENPHEHAVVDLIERWARQHLPLKRENGPILDMACGSGEVTRALLALGVPRERITACDPYTSGAFMARVDDQCEPWSFEDIGSGVFDGLTERYSTVICSFGLHLCLPSWLPVVCLALARVSDQLVILTPHKRPTIESSWGWAIEQDVLEPASRVRMRTYKSNL
jgi:hypothetical protein